MSPEVTSKDLGVRLTMDELSHPGPPHPRIPIDNEVPSKKNFLWIPDQFPTLIEIVVCSVVRFLPPIGHRPGRVPDDNICIRVRYQGAFPGIKAEYFSRIGAREGDKLIW